MNRFALVLLVACLAVAPLGATGTARAQGEPPAATETYDVEAWNRRLLIVGLGMIVGVIAVNFAAEGLAPTIASATELGATAQAGMAWAGAQIVSAGYTLAGLVGLTAPAVATVTAAAPAATATAATAAGAAATAATATTTTAAAAAAAAPAVATVTAAPAHGLGVISAILGTLFGHYSYELFAG